ncbi:hypothetical protein OHA25_33390 [Nonomuraea sp. NBC_00507]|uniref:hypothetical protein n=1 Tax=Nonomuraea sp. NBC_00507 TaxID=2976002 RepID=UPI002E1880B0
MDSHGSASPTHSPRASATSRSAGGAAVTRRRQTEHRIVGFRDVEQLPNETWTAVHKASGTVITAPSFEALERVEAPMVRIAYAWRRAS